MNLNSSWGPKPDSAPFPIEYSPITKPLIHRGAEPPASSAIGVFGRKTAPAAFGERLKRKRKNDMPYKVKLFQEEDSVGVWVNYRDDARVKIRPISKSKIRELRAQATSSEREWKNGQIVERNGVNERLYDRLLADYVIEDWENFQDQDGQDLPCDVQHKYLMIDQVFEFSRFVHTASTNIQEYLTQKEEELTENLSFTSNG